MPESSIDFFLKMMAKIGTLKVNKQLLKGKAKA